MTHHVPGVQVGFFVLARQRLAQGAHALEEAVAEGEQGVGQLHLVAGQTLRVDVPAVGRQRREHRAGRGVGGRRLHLAAHLLRVAVQDQVADGRVNQPHLEHLRHTRALGVGQAALHHHREHHGRGLADAVFGVLFQLAGDVQHLGQLRQHITLGQAGAEQQGARQRPLLHEDGLGPRNLGGVRPVRKSPRLRHVVLQGLGDRRIGRRALRPVARQRRVVCPQRHQPVRLADALQALAGGRTALLPGTDQRRHGPVGQRIGHQLHRRQIGHGAFRSARRIRCRPRPAVPRGPGHQHRQAHREECNRPDFHRMPQEELEHQPRRVDQDRHQHRQRRAIGWRRRAPRRCDGLEAAENEQRHRHPAGEALQRLAEPATVGLLHDPGLEHEDEIRVGAKVERGDHHRPQPGRQQAAAQRGLGVHRLAPEHQRGHHVTDQADREPHQRNRQWHIAQPRAEHLGVGVAAEEPAAGGTHLLGEPAQRQRQASQRPGTARAQQPVRRPGAGPEHRHAGEHQRQRQRRPAPGGMAEQQHRAGSGQPVQQTVNGSKGMGGADGRGGNGRHHRQ